MKTSGFVLLRSMNCLFVFIKFPAQSHVLSEIVYKALTSFEYDRLSWWCCFSYFKMESDCDRQPKIYIGDLNMSSAVLHKHICSVRSTAIRGIQRSHINNYNLISQGKSQGFCLFSKFSPWLSGLLRYCT